MTFWPFFQFSLAVVVTGFWLRDELKDKEEVLFVLVDLIAKVALAICALAYWFVPLSNSIGPAAPAIFTASVAWACVSTARDFRKDVPGSDLPPALRRFSFVLGIALYLAVFGPLYYWGYLSTFLRLHNGT